MSKLHQIANRIADEIVSASCNTNEVYMVNNGDLRVAANQAGWSIQSNFEAKLEQLLADEYDKTLVRTSQFHDEEDHGFVRSQKNGCQTFERIPREAPLIVLLTVWEYSHHIASSLYHHDGPVLILANFEGTFPGLVGLLNLAGTMTSLGRPYSRLWSIDFKDEFFLRSLDEWLSTGRIDHDTAYLTKAAEQYRPHADGAELGEVLADYVLHKKQIIGLYDMFCMGMINGVFPMESLIKIGMPLESFSQSQLLVEMAKVDEELREACLQFYIDRGMTFHFGDDPETELTREQVLEQCAMMIAMARAWKKFGCAAIGVQYQQGLKDCCPASDFAEGALNDSLRFPIPDEDGQIIAPGKPILCINEVDMGTAIPQVMLYRILDALAQPAETTLHDIRWGSEYDGVFYWDFEISGSVPFSHLKGGIKGAHGYRQPPMYFPLGGSTIAGQCKAGRFVWARAHYVGTEVFLHLGTGSAYELPEEEFKRRSQATTKEWPLMNAVLDGVTRDQLMAGHESNHITVAYVDADEVDVVKTALVVMGQRLGMQVYLAGIE